MERKINWVLSVSFGELTLKGANRRNFEDQAIRRIRRALRPLGEYKMYKEIGKLYIEADVSEFDAMITELKKVFGLVYITPCVKCDKDQEAIGQAVVDLLEAANYEGPQTFKVDTKRIDKRFEPKSPQMNAAMGGVVLRNFPAWKVDVHNPQRMVYIDIKDHAYVYCDRTPGLGGLPVGSSGRGLLLLSGGIDSPVAGYLIAKRGVAIDALYFHSYPFTSERSDEKVRTLAKKLTPYTGDITLHEVNILGIQQAINENCREREMTILSRRFMMRIGERLCKEKGYHAMVTGESLGQVASQTIQSMGVINEVTDLPILRPLVAMDKVQIMDIAHEIDTYETSILPYIDSCTVFLPKRPVTKPRLHDIQASEAKLDIEGLVDAALETMRITEIKEDL